MNSSFLLSGTLAAVIPEHPSKLQGILLLAAGFVVVMLVLTVMMVFMKFLGVVFAKKPAEAPCVCSCCGGVATAATAAPAPAAPAAPATDAHLIAVISAAAYTMLGASARVVSIKPASSEWGSEGRRVIFDSHKTR